MPVLSSRRFAWPILALLPLAVLAAVLLFARTTQAASPQQAGGPGATANDVNRVARQLYCPVCPNTPLNVCETQACQDWRELIRQKLDAGANDQEIIDYFVAQYGQRVLAQPQPSGFNLLVWVIPIGALLAGGGALAAVLRSWRSSRSAAPPPAPSAGERLPDDYVARIERELQLRR